MAVGAIDIHHFLSINTEKREGHKNLGKEKLMTEKIGKKTQSITAIFLIAVFAVSMLAVIPTGSTQTTKTTTAAFSYAFPQVIGVGQTVYLSGWISPPMATANTFYYNLTMIVRCPNGTEINKFFNHSDVGAGVNTPLVCDALGTWSMSLKWPGDETHEGSLSTPFKWIVQEEQVNTTPPLNALPTDYWEFPISAQDYIWYQISGPWAQNRYDGAQAQFNPYSTGPNTPHIIWRKQVVPGGLIGGEEEAMSIQGSFSPSLENNIGLANYVAANGRLYYTTRDFKNNGSQCFAQLHCVNQYTGEEIYAVDLDLPLAAPSANPQAFPPGRPTLFFEAAGQQKGGTGVRTATVTGAYSLWVSGNGLREVDPMTGNTIYNRTDISPSIYADGFFYFVKGGNLTCWSTRSKTDMWSISGLPAPNYVWQGILVYSNKGYNGVIKTTTFNATTGEMIANGTLKQYSVTLSQCVADGQIFYSCADLKMRAVSLYTCQQTWESEKMEYPYGSAQAYSQSAAYGYVYSGMLDGHVYCWNTTTGKLVWKYYSGNTTNTGFGTYPFWGNIVIADGKLYVATGEHTTPNPMPYGYSLYCLDAYNGTVIWNYPSFATYTFASVGFGSGISAGMLFYQNMDDGCLYMFGKGQTQTTVTAPETTVPQGTTVLIKGTITDKSPGSEGTPAIADQDQSAWMQYVYNNAPEPTNATGVPVTLTAIAQDGTTENIGVVTSDKTGNFAALWTPPSAGLYKIYANFEGTNAYWSSDAETALGIQQAATVTPSPTPDTRLGTITYISIAATAVIVALLLAVIAILLISRKKHA